MNVPVAALAAAPFVEARREKTDSFFVVDVLLLVLALLLLVSPIIVEYLLRRSRQPLPQCVDVHQLLLLIGVGASSTVSLMGLVSVSFGGGSSAHVYGSVALSVIFMLFYSWRYRCTLV